MFKRFLKDTTGSVAVMFALVAVPLFLSAGIALDYARLTRLSGQMQAAADSAALAGAAFETDSDEERIAEAKKYFRQNFPDLDIDPVVTIEDGTVIVDVTQSLPATFVSLIGIENLSPSTHAEAVIASAAKAEVALVLDYSGSMNRDGKYQAMRDSAINLINGLMEDDTDEKIKIGLVPFSEYVYTDMRTDYIRDVHSDKYGNTVRACLDSRRYPYATQSTTPELNVQNSKWPAPGLPEEFTESGSLSGGQDPNETIIEADYCTQVAQDYLTTCLANIDPNLGDDDDDGGGNLAAAQQACQDTTDHLLARDECSRTLTQSEQNNQQSEALHSDFAASHAQCNNYRDRNLLAQPLTTDEVVLTSQLQVMSPVRLTNIALALEFGWHMITSNAPYTEGVNSNDDDTLKAVVLLTDGAQTVGGFGPGGNFSINQGDTNTEELCEAIKAQDILMVTIAFDLANNGNVRDRLEDCATSPEFFFRADTNEELAEAFEQITTQLQEPVRLVR